MKAGVGYWSCCNGESGVRGAGWQNLEERNGGGRERMQGDETESLLQLLCRPASDLRGITENSCCVGLRGVSLYPGNGLVFMP